MARNRQDPNLGILLFVAYRALEQRAHEAVLAAGFTDITQAQARMAARIGPDGTRVTDLAEQTRITKQSAGFLIKQLEEAGYVELVPDPADGRAKLARLTTHANAIVRIANAEVERALSEWENHVGADRLRQVTETLVDLREIVDPWR